MTSRTQSTFAANESPPRVELRLGLTARRGILLRVSVYDPSRPVTKVIGRALPLR